MTLFAWCLTVACFYAAAHYLSFGRPQESGELTLPDSLHGSVTRADVVKGGALVFVAMSLILMLTIAAMVLFPWIFRWGSYLIVFGCGFYFAAAVAGRPRPLPGLAGGAALVLIWAFSGNWLTHDAVTVVCGMAMLVAMRNIPFLACVAVSLGILAYDALAVFGTGHMLKLLGTLEEDSLVLIKVPQSLSLSAQPAFVLGVGDLVLPGLIILVAGRLFGWRGAVPAIAGNVLGHIAAISAVSFFAMSQPATIYLIPLTYLFGIGLPVFLYGKKAITQ